ncbi:GLIPR1-like protein 1 isoform X1 [Ochotona princeps]|uniref:GLIPR1-like protein 1 isoform X1 n=2 Tax=Ochotona princeps TaxID=9978 RepID=UPI00064C1F5A|nr:GLIPR1-like protein 1 isoform X1 [Ochotona princeps]
MSLERQFGYLWTLVLYLITTESFKVPSITDPHFIDECIRAHNECRGRVSPPASNMKYMIWDDALARLAKGWANTCQFKHNDCVKLPFECMEEYQFLGENIWLGALQIFSPTDAIVAWYNETEFFDYDTLSCTDACGHYTQVVWANSFKVGCAAKICPNLGEDSPTIFMCNYAPTGNYRGQHPYKKGPPCSECEQSEKCVKNLCKVPQISMPEVITTHTHDIHEQPELARAPQVTAWKLLSLTVLLQKIF